MNLYVFFVLIFLRATLQAAEGCPMISQPICGYDANAEIYMTFRSICGLEATNLIEKSQFKIFNAGHCEKDSRCQISICPMNWTSSICGHDSEKNHSQFFPNNCKMENINCIYKKNYKKTENEKCSNEEPATITSAGYQFEEKHEVYVKNKKWLPLN